MVINRKSSSTRPAQLPKVRTGIRGLDEITGGGLPKGRPTLVCGGPGSGKTLLAMEFLVRGATEYKEAGVFISFEETAQDLISNVASLGFDLKNLIMHKNILIEHIPQEQRANTHDADVDLDALFVRIHHAIEKVGAKRIVIDTIESLFTGMHYPSAVRARLQQLLRWSKAKGATTIITAERGDGSLTRQGLEEYVADCVLLLDTRVREQMSIRRLRIVKYRGSSHGTNEYPFIIDENGFSVLPITSLGLNHQVSMKRISSGVPQLDVMLSNKGFFQASTILISGSAGTGKTNFAATFVEAACRRGERALYFTFEESPSQFLRNIGSIGIQLDPWIKKGLCQLHAIRPTLCGLENHLISTMRLVNDFRPSVVVFDPINDFVTEENMRDVKSMFLRMVDFLKMRRITALFTSLTAERETKGTRDVYVSSLIDTWIQLRNIEDNEERTRGLYVLKSRGMSHSNRIREFIFTNCGIALLDVYFGKNGVLTGTARRQQQDKDASEQLQRSAKLSASMPQC